MKPNKARGRLVCIRLRSRGYREWKGSGQLGEEKKRGRRRRESYKYPDKGKLSASAERRSQEMTGSIERCCRSPKQLRIIVNGLQLHRLGAPHL